MPILDIFSKRQRRSRGELPDIYQYDNFPRKFRAQIIYILRDALGNPNHYNSITNDLFRQVHDALCREYGEFTLAEEFTREGDFQRAIFKFFLETTDIEKALDVIELALLLTIDLQHDWNFKNYSQPTMTADEAVEETNSRFREHGIGFQFEGGEIVRVDSQFLHQEAVRPALGLLNQKSYEGANQEFLTAHEHYRHGRFKEAIAEAAKALESTLKVIGMRRNWPIKNTDTAKTLISVLFDENLVPSYLQSEFTALRTTLESGVPTVRNKVAGHGQGANPTLVPDYLASYVLHLTASTIVFLIKADNH